MLDQGIQGWHNPVVAQQPRHRQDPAVGGVSLRRSELSEELEGEIGAGLAVDHGVQGTGLDVGPHLLGPRLAVEKETRGLGTELFAVVVSQGGQSRLVEPGGDRDPELFRGPVHALGDFCSCELPAAGGPRRVQCEEHGVADLVIGLVVKTGIQSLQGRRGSDGREQGDCPASAFLLLFHEQGNGALSDALSYPPQGSRGGIAHDLRLVGG